MNNFYTILVLVVIPYCFIKIQFFVFAGYYVYIETSSPRKNGDRAWLVSRTYPPTPKGKCLNFYYHMYGSDINTLKIHVTPVSAPSGKTVWTRIGNKGDKWHHGQATMISTVSYKVCYLVSTLERKSFFLFVYFVLCW